jgi:hypothetical protein
MEDITFPDIFVSIRRSLPGIGNISDFFGCVSKTESTSDEREELHNGRLGVGDK